MDDETKEIVSLDLLCPNSATKDVYGSGGGEQICDRCEYVDEEVEAVELFFSGGDEIQRRC
jgi:hypothetical protein